MFIRLAYKSLLDRKGSILMTLLAISVSVFVLLGIEHIRQQAKESFSNTLSGTDLIVGARTSNLNLLLYSVFRVGNPTNNIGWETYNSIATNTNIVWTIPISLGDSHKGYRVVGTNTDYFKHYKYGSKRTLEFNEGAPFDHLFDVVLGAEVANKLGYSLDQKVTLSHGLGTTSFSNHDDKPFRIVGILEATGTPVDRALYVSLEAITAIHIGWQQGVKIPGAAANTNTLDTDELAPESITAFMVGLKSKMTTFSVQRAINNYPEEPLMAILPGVTLAEFWQTLSTTEDTLRLISLLVLIAALLGLSSLLLASIRERQTEIAVIRMLGASPWFIFSLIQLEAFLITFFASLLGAVMLYIALAVSAEQIATEFGLYIETNFLSEQNLLALLLVQTCSVIVCLIPSITAYRKAL